MARRDIKAVIYTDDEGNDFVIGLDAAVFAQLGAGSARKVGGADYTGAPPLPEMPRNLKPRTVTVSDATLGKRRVTCLTKTAPLFVGTETAIDLDDTAGGVTAFTRYRANGEHWNVRRDPNG